VTEGVRREIADENQIEESVARWSLRLGLPRGPLHSLFSSRFTELEQTADELESVTDESDLWRVLDARAPELSESLRLDLGRQELLDLWGLSSTIDRAAGTDHLKPCLRRIFPAVTGEPGVAHAGLAHVYGYLFSQIPGRYGRKRHRWSSGVVGFVLGQSPEWPLGTTSILGSITVELQKIAPLDHPGPALLPDGLASVGELVETAGNWTARTRLFSRSEATYLGESVLVVYSLAEHGGRERYITSFCQTPETAARLLTSRDTGEPHLRFNAVI